MEAGVDASEVSEKYPNLSPEMRAKYDAAPVPVKLFIDKLTGSGTSGPLVQDENFNKVLDLLLSVNPPLAESDLTLLIDKLAPVTVESFEEIYGTLVDALSDLDKDVSNSLSDKEWVQSMLNRIADFEQWHIPAIGDIYLPEIFDYDAGETLSMYAYGKTTTGIRYTVFVNITVESREANQATVVFNNLESKLAVDEYGVANPYLICGKKKASGLN